MLKKRAAVLVLLLLASTLIVFMTEVDKKESYSTGLSGMDTAEWVDEPVQIKEPEIKEGGLSIYGEKPSYERIWLIFQEADGSVLTDRKRCEHILDMLFWSETVPEKPFSQAEKKQSGIPSVNRAFYQDTERSTAGKYCFVYNGVFDQKEPEWLFTGMNVFTDWDHDTLHEIGTFRIQAVSEGIMAKDAGDVEEAMRLLDEE